MAKSLPNADDIISDIVLFSVYDFKTPPTEQNCHTCDKPIKKILATFEFVTAIHYRLVTLSLLGNCVICDPDL